MPLSSAVESMRHLQMYQNQQELTMRREQDRARMEDAQYQNQQEVMMRREQDRARMEDAHFVQLQNEFRDSKSEIERSHSAN